ncbi:MAG: DUF362 domain-containing protein [Proteobacteria bacterium]|nr:DUF362 domain-containing protein [Pseudomonadota bacterium]
MNRREFIKRSAACAAYATAGMALSGLVGPYAGADQAPDIVLANGSPGPAAWAAVKALGGMQRFVRPGDRVVIKPNMSFPNPPDWATTTHPEVVRALTEMCIKAGAGSVLVLDNPLRNPELCVERSGLKAACGDLPQAQIEGITNRRFFEEVKVPEGKALKATMIMKAVLEANVLIAAPVAKSHSATGVSLAMKGMMGLIYDRMAFHLDLDLDEAVVDLCTVLRPKLTVIDASRLLSEGGPGGPGKVIKLNKVIASTDMVAADAMAVEQGTWYGRKFKAKQVKHVRIAHQRGLGNLEVKSQIVKEVSA